MSMFHELMMRKKEQIMYATIKGTLTENDGVFSGFAYNNYLVTQEEFDYSKDFEIVLKTNTGTLSNFKILLRSNYGSNAGESGFAIGIQGGKLRTYIINSSGGYISNGVYGTTVFNNNTDCFFRFSQKVNNDTYMIKLESSTGGINWTTENSWTSSLQIRSSGQGVAFGGGNLNATDQYWGGSIDLPNSYIKLGSTKYKLQAVVGYTVVGSLTESPSGVFSGFVTNSDYLKLAQQIETWDTNLEAKIDIITPSVAPANAEIICANGNMQQGIRLTTSLVVSYQLYDVGGTYKYCNTPTLEPNTRYTIIFKYNKQTKKMSLRVIGTNIDNTIEETLSSSPRDNINATYNTIFFGAVNSNYVYAFTGSIDIANSYIKINNKLWFNGQQA